MQILTVNFLNSQTSISGIVRDKDSNPVSFSNVFIKSQVNNSIVAFTRTLKDGSYVLEVEESGNYEISFTAILYKPTIFQIAIETGKKYIQNVILQDETTFLDEVVIKTEKPITVKTDTIVINAKAFAQGNETVLEDLLRKIPGLNISENGTIKVGTKEVEKVMIDGDDFFEHGYKLLTKNLNASTVDKIEIYKKYSNNRLLKNIENSDKVALNLTLKDEIKSQWFGNMSLGYGVASENRYDVRTNLMSFEKKAKFYAIGNLNNVGVDAVGDINYIIRPVNLDGISSIGDDENSETLLSLNTSKPNLKEERTNFNNAELISLNSIFTISSKVKLKVIGFYNSDKNDFFRKGIDEYHFENTAFTNFEDYNLSKKKKIGFAKINFNYDISSNESFEFISKYSLENGNTNTNLIFNEEKSWEKLNEKTQLIDQKAVYTNRFRSNKVLIFTGRIINEKAPQNYYNNVFLFNDILPGGVTANNVSQGSNDKLNFLGFETHFFDKKQKGNLLEFKAGYENRQDYFNSELEFLENDNSIIAPADYANKVNFGTQDIYFKSKYNYFFRKFAIEAKVELHDFISDLKTTEIVEKNNNLFINPSLVLSWEINQNNKISTSFSYNTTNAKILDVYNGYVLTSYKSFQKGTGQFNQLQSNVFFLKYGLGNWESKFSSNASIYYYKNFDFYSTNAVILQNYSQLEKIIIKNRSMFRADLDMSYFFSDISSTLKVEANYSKSNYKNIVNNELREVESGITVSSIEIRSNFKGFLNYHLGTKWTINEIRTSDLNKNTDNLTFFDLLLSFNKNLNAEFQTERYHFGNLEASSSKYYFLDIKANYIFKKNKLSFSLSSNNLFNTKTFRQSYISDVVTSKTEYRILPRYVLLKMDYKF
ncbi:carboxypeptidase regulatory-like domain-containing protein [Flavobacterium sp.]|uniref:carboxypeptidase regulatory-like domain-containing protein n=1 Tax=Flavobacterium sp. TaxID=239 RepID=UPI00374DEC68